MITRTSKVWQYGGYLAAGTIGAFVSVLFRQYEIVNNYPDWNGAAGMFAYPITAAVLGGLWDRLRVKDKKSDYGGWLISCFFGFLPLGVFHQLGWLHLTELFLFLRVN